MAGEPDAQFTTLDFYVPVLGGSVQVKDFERQLNTIRRFRDGSRLVSAGPAGMPAQLDDAGNGFIQYLVVIDNAPNARVFPHGFRHIPGAEVSPQPTGPLSKS